MLLQVIVTGCLVASVSADAPVTTKPQANLLSPVRPLPCHSVTMIKDVRPTEFLFIAPGNSGDCSFIFEGLQDGRLDIKVRNLKSNLPRGNGDPCEDGQVRLYNYKGSGAVNLAQRLCDNEKEVSMLTDSNMAIVASSLIDGSFSVVARSVRQTDLLGETDVDQFLTPPETTTHDWNTATATTLAGEVTDKEEEMDDNKDNEEDEGLDEEIVIDNEPSAFDNSDGSLDDVKEPSEFETPPNSNNLDFFLAGTNMTGSNTTDHNKTHCGYDYYGNYICYNTTGGNNTVCGYDYYGDYICYNITGNHTDHTNHSDYYPHGHTPHTEYHAPAYNPYEPKPIYAPPYEHHSSIYEAPKPIYHAPKPIYKPPEPIYTAPKPIYSAPKPIYSPPKPVYKPPEPIYSAPKPIYKPPEPVYSKPVYKSPHDYYEYKPIYEKPFRPSQPIPNNYWDGYKSHSHTSNYRSPVWYQDHNEHGPYPGKPTKHVSLTHDSYPSYPSYYNPGYYGHNNVTTSTTHAPMTNATTKPSRRTTMMKVTKKERPPTTTMKTTKRMETTTHKTKPTTHKTKPTTHKTKLTTTVPTKKTTLHHNHELLGVPLPWTANVTITSGDNLDNSIEQGNPKASSTTPKITLNRIIQNLPKLFRQ